MRYFLERNVSSHQKWLSSQNGINFSLVRPPSFYVRTYTLTQWSGSSRQCKPIPLLLSANKWLPAGWKKGTVRNALNHFQLIPPPLCLKGLKKDSFSMWCVWRGTYAASWLWGHTDIDLSSSWTTCMAGRPHTRPVGIRESLRKDRSWLSKQQVVNVQIYEKTFSATVSSIISFLH